MSVLYYVNGLTALCTPPAARDPFARVMDSTSLRHVGMPFSATIIMAVCMHAPSLAVQSALLGAVDSKSQRVFLGSLPIHNTATGPAQVVLYLYSYRV